ncbi:phosphohistidine phosphatase SixA [Pseudoalteromonas sp.]|uniref:phosphohistidine phosphatase SixA n=1 Tax=Pseudoalteromonas sp. TaxID=53249 RepID=UPI003567CB9C
MKKIFIMRHGQAQSFSQSDESRMLTELGRLEAHSMAKKLQQDCQIDAILTSTYVRAKQTADIVAAKQESIRYQESFDDFIPSADAENAAELIKAMVSYKPNLNNWILVAHMPIVSYIVEQFCPDNMPVFATAAVAEIHYNEESGLAQLVAMHLPDVDEKAS